MSQTGVLAYGAVSALGRGDAAIRAGLERELTRVGRDEELVAAGLRRPFCARAIGFDDATGDDRAAVLLEAALVDCIEMLDRARPAWRTERVGLVLGTSSGGMRSFEGGAKGIAATYAGPVATVVARAGLTFAPASIVLAACASSAVAIGLGRAWLHDDRCDVVLAGGFDAVSVFVAAGFESLRATCSERGPRPFRLDRDGLALGEGAALLALARTDAARAFITGFGATCDAHHLTSPHPNGDGLARAARAAMTDAGSPPIGLISAHGTATPHNDAAEARALAQLTAPSSEPIDAALVELPGDDFEPGERDTLVDAPRVLGEVDESAPGAASLGSAPLFSFKGTIGHTLGAAGALEVLAAVDALERGSAPATVGVGPAEPGVQVLDVPVATHARTALKLASAFGGANAALVVTLDATTASSRASAGPGRPVHVSRAVRVDSGAIEPALLAERSGYPLDRIVRADELVRWSLAAVSALREKVGALQGAGIVVGLGLATIETNARFLARLARPEPRRFPYTTPNAAAGECAVAFGLDGPAFAVGAGPHGGVEAICVAADLVRAGLADRIVVVAADEAGEASGALAPGTTSGAVALVVQSTPGAAELEDWGVRYAPNGAERALPPMDAHRALVSLVDDRPAEITAPVPWGGQARIQLRWAGNAPRGTT